jgi:hypothetical protein
LVIAGVGALALGTGLYRAAFGLRLAIPAGLAAAAAFLAVDLLMDAVGWRVGAPDAGRRATMVVVTAIGLLAAASQKRVAIAPGTVANTSRPQARLGITRRRIGGR